MGHTCLLAGDGEDLLDGSGVEFHGFGDLGQNLVERVRRLLVEQDADGLARPAAVAYDRHQLGRDVVAVLFHRRRRGSTAPGRPGVLHCRPQGPLPLALIGAVL